MSTNEDKPERQPYKVSLPGWRTDKDIGLGDVSPKWCVNKPQTEQRSRKENRTTRRN